MATITAQKDGVEIGTAQSDAFGEFRIDKLEPGSGQITIEIKCPGYQAASRGVELGESQYLGCLELQSV